MESDREPPAILEFLRLNGFRITRSRRAVIRVLDESNSWLLPEEIHTRAQDYYPSIGLVTVYRTLALLGELGLSRRIHLENGCHGYIRTRMGHSHNLVCRECQETIEIPGSDDIKHFIDHVSRETGFHIDKHVLELIGVCPDCLPAAEGDPQ